MLHLTIGPPLLLYYQEWIFPDGMMIHNIAEVFCMKLQRPWIRHKIVILSNVDVNATQWHIQGFAVVVTSLTLTLDTVRAFCQ